MKVALVYDRVNKWGGAERLLLTLHKMFPRAPLYTSVYDKKSADWAKVFPKVHTSFLQNIPWFRKRHEYLAPLMPIAFESFDFSEYDLVISVTSESAKGIITLPKTAHISIILAPTRYLWNFHDHYFSKRVKLLLSPIINYLKNWDKIAAKRPDLLISISMSVRKKILDYYGRNSDVVYPPSSLKAGRNSKIKRIKNKDNYYLIVSRLVKYKSIDIAIEAFNQLNLPLVIVGRGKEERKLKAMARGNTRFMGQLTDEDLTEYYKNCKAVIFPQEEDFGLVAVEAQSFGKPVIAYNKGGAREIVIPNKTGVFFEDQNPEDLIQAVHNLGKLNLDPKDCINNARQFSEVEFINNFERALSINGYMNLGREN